MVILRHIVKRERPRLQKLDRPKFKIPLLQVVAV